VDELVRDVRVPPDSIRKCQRDFIQKGLQYLEKPERRPTWREADVEKMLAILENPPPPESREWDSATVRYIGVYFTARQIKEIRNCIKANPDYSIAEIAHKVCLMFNLYQRNGTIKKSTMITIFKRMGMDNIITLNQLPKKRYKKPVPPAAKGITETPQIKTFKCHELEPIHFVQVRTQEDSILWNNLIAQYHYIKQYRIYGTQLRYLVYGGKDIVNPIYMACNPVNNNKGCHPEDFQEGHLLALLGFGPSAWRLTSRDDYIGWNDEQRTAKLHLIVNNVRFLILPWIRSTNLASRILSGITKQLPEDWEMRYGYRPLLLETFVQLDRFRGTCYKAANWIQIGTTNGYNLITRERKNVPAKAIFIYPFNKSFRRILCNY